MTIDRSWLGLKRAELGMGDSALAVEDHRERQRCQADCPSGFDRSIAS